MKNPSELSGTTGLYLQHPFHGPNWMPRQRLLAICARAPRTRRAQPRQCLGYTMATLDRQYKANGWQTPPEANHVKPVEFEHAEVLQMDS
ncbi:hypothetical protein T265_13893, partial [Opisthorchis viverrini]